MNSTTRSDPLVPRDARALRQALLRAVDEQLDGNVGSAERTELLEQLLGARICKRLAIYPLPEAFVLSVVIPVYNEFATVRDVIERVRNTGIPCEIILVDDGSTDGTREIIGELNASDIKVVLHPFMVFDGGADDLKGSLHLSHRRI